MVSSDDRERYRPRFFKVESLFLHGTILFRTLKASGES